jgi:hypothetical protein
MIYVTLAAIDDVDDNTRGRLETETAFTDTLIDKAQTGFLLATSPEKISLEGVEYSQIKLIERDNEQILGVISPHEFNLSLQVFRAYADPFTSPSTVQDEKISDGFIISAGKTYDCPCDSLRLLKAIRDGVRIQAVYRKAGEESLNMSSRTMLSRTGPYHLPADELIGAFRDSKPPRAGLISFTVKDGKLTVDNTFKPKTIKTR